MLTNPILLDYQSSTPCSKEVLKSMEPYWSDFFANPSSKSNLAAISASAALEVSREKIQNYLKLPNKKVIFTSGATESNNLALLGYARSFYKKTNIRGNIITLATEHKAVLEPLQQLEKEGFSLTEILPEEDGLISIGKLLGLIKEDTFLISIMLANNEIGVIQPLKEIADICKSRNLILHSDAAQCLGYLPLELMDDNINMITISSHKIYGPKGVGILLLDRDIEISPLFWGGGQEQGLRPGTVPVPLIVGCAKAIELAVLKQDQNFKKLANHRDYLLNELLKSDFRIKINGSMKNRLPHNLNITILDINGTQLHKHLKAKIVCSSGSACSKGSPSHVLKAIGRSTEESEASLRISIGLMTTSEEIKLAHNILLSTFKYLRR